MGGQLQLYAECRDGLCVLRVAGELDTLVADTFADRADAVVRAVPGLVMVDLSGLTFLDASGARALATMIHTALAGRLAGIRSCPALVRRVMNLLGLSLGYLAVGAGNAVRPETRELVDRVRRERLYASMAKCEARSVLARLTDTCIRLASTREQTELIQERGRRTLASSRAARERAMQAPQEAAL